MSIGLLRNIRNIRICKGGKTVSVKYECENLSHRNFTFQWLRNNADTFMSSLRDLW